MKNKIIIGSRGSKLALIYAERAKVELLKKSFHSAINTSYSQMFSYIKVLDICDENITFTCCTYNRLSIL